MLTVVCMCASVFARDKFVDYEVRANTAVTKTVTERYFAQMGYSEDFEHTKQCNDRPKPNVLVFRRTGEGQAGISGLSRCVFVTITERAPNTTLRVEVTDHLRGGLSLPATTHYGSDRIHKDYDDAFAEIARKSQAGEE